MKLFVEREGELITTTVESLSKDFSKFIQSNGRKILARKGYKILDKKKCRHTKNDTATDRGLYNGCGGRVYGKLKSKR